MDRVVAAQRKLLSELASLACEMSVDADQRQFALQRLEVIQRAPVGRGGEAGATSRGCERRASLRVVEDARDRRMRGSPQLGDQVGPLLGDDQLDERRGVEVEDQRRCSATSSDTNPRAFTRARRAARRRLGAVTRPRRTRSCRGSLSSTADRRAIGRPRASPAPPRRPEPAPSARSDGRAAHAPRPRRFAHVAS
jgi:hypothetical protein